ncbi:GntR family transcriptional regulator [Demequina sp. NBRC 110056]|uniref:GntR family transcriptional regulator n=1 Tax=Demequina sp. NBRC 110056 TaxID=1570345 RepID=UPI0009FFD124|nr:GntR family transcriptional regulator [Demequina sp. NBRC 110056]
MRTSERVYRQLCDEILDGTLAPGAVLAEVEQAERLGVSRTPLREALARLQAEGLVVARGGRGLIVAALSPQNVRELHEVREALEVKAARLAALRRDPEVFDDLRAQVRESARDLDTAGGRAAFYETVGRMDAAIDAAAASPHLLAALRGVRVHVARVRRLAQDDAERLRSAAHEHLMILDAIVEGNESMAAHATELHLHRSLAAVLSAMAASTVPVPVLEESRP